MRKLWTVIALSLMPTLAHAEDGNGAWFLMLVTSMDKDHIAQVIVGAERFATYPRCLRQAGVGMEKYAKSGSWMCAYVPDQQ